MTALTPNQVIAFNLAQARALRGWTQEEAAERLEPYLGTRWSKVTFSTAERSVIGKRVRNFDADEIAAFALAFDLPIAWFFTPPAGVDARRWGARAQPGQTSERASVELGGEQFDFGAWLERVYPGDVEALADELRARARLQAEGETDAERVRAGWHVVRDHLIAWVRSLGMDPSVGGLEATRKALDAIELLLAIDGTHADEEPEESRRDES